jgi:hypothetical protein
MKTNHRQCVSLFVDKATEFEGEKQHGKNLYDCRAKSERWQAVKGKNAEQKNK